MSKTKAVLFKPINSKASISKSLCIGASSIEIVPFVRSVGVFFRGTLKMEQTRR